MGPRIVAVYGKNVSEGILPLFEKNVVPIKGAEYRIGL